MHKTGELLFFLFFLGGGGESPSQIFFFDQIIFLSENLICGSGTNYIEVWPKEQNLQI